MSATVSLVMPTYNRAQYVGAAIASVLRQTYPDWELLVWDDGSTDNSAAIAQAYAQIDPRVRVVVATHQGQTASLRNALAQTEGTYLGWVDSDDLLAPTALAATVAALETHPEVGWVYTDYVNIDANSRLLSYGRRCRIPYSPQRLLVDFMTFHFRLIRRSAYGQVGGIDPSVKQCEDYDLCLRLSETAPVQHIAQPLYFYRRHGYSLTAQKRALQVEWSIAIINRALRRRGLEQQFKLIYTDNRFILVKIIEGDPLPPAVVSRLSSLLAAASKAKATEIERFPASPRPTTTWQQAKTPPLKPVSLFLATVPLVGMASKAQALVAPPPGQRPAPPAVQPAEATPAPVASVSAPQPETSLLPQFSPLIAQAVEASADGATTVTQSGNQFTITGGQTSGDLTNLFHSFEQFNLSAEQIATFLAQPELRNILGRVGGGDPSIINGLIQVVGSDANLFLVNPAGILLGPGTRLDMGGSLTLSTANAVGFGDQWFNTVGPNDYASLNGTPDALAFTTEQPGVIVNGGQLAVNPGQSISLIGGTVLNTGQITASGGSVALAAVPGESVVRLSQPGRLLSLEVDRASLPAVGGLSMTELPELLTGSSLAVGLGVNGAGQGVLTATNTAIPTGSGVAIAAGHVDVSSADGAGGTVAVIGDRVGLVGATINATGRGGGRILVGGDYQGQGIPSASFTVVDAASVLDASSSEVGDGGEVIVWADDTTGFYGNILARGGDLSGDGGFVEVSGQENLLFRGQVDVGAADRVGTLLLDPVDITIVSGDGGEDDNQLNLNVPEGDLAGQIFDFEGGEGPDFTISENALEALAANAEVILEASNDIVIEDLADNELTFAAGPGGSITFVADANQSGFGDFLMRDTGDTIRAEGRDVTISGANLTLGRVSTASDSLDAGDISIQAQTIDTDSEIVVESLDAASNQGAGGTVTVTALVGFGYDAGIEVGDVSTFSNQGPGGNIEFLVDAENDGLLSLSGETTFNAGSGTVRTRGVAIAAGPNSFTLTADEIDLDPTLPVSGTGNLTLQPGTPDTDIIIGDADSSAGGLNLTAELPQLRPGFNRLTIGRADGNSTIAVLSDLSFPDPTEFRAQGPGGQFTAPGVALTGIGDAAITITTTLDITAGDITANAGINLSSRSITTGNLNTSGPSQAGPVTVLAEDRITVGQINASSSFGNGGNVFLDPEGDIEVAFIDAQGGPNGIGGTVDITSERFFRATRTFIDQNEIEASISTAGGLEGGRVTIRHGGGSLDTPFAVGADFNGDNGTAGAITTGRDNTIAAGEFPETYEQGSPPDPIQLITQDRPSNELPDIETEPPPGLSPVDPLPPSTKTAIKELDEAREILRQIEAATGIKPALVYVQFMPATVSLTPGAAEPTTVEAASSFVRRETDYTQSFEAYLELPEEATQPPVLSASDQDQLELMVITAEGPPIWQRVGASRAEVLEMAQKFRLEVADPRKTYTDSYRPSAAALYDWIIAPLQAELEAREIGNLTFLADAGLRSVPWAALYGNNQFLVQQYSVGLMPSLSLADTRFVDVRNAKMLAMGAAEFETQRQLPAVPTELDNLSALWQANVVPEDQFTFDTLRQQRQDTPYGIVHLATHGEFQPGRPENSYIQLKDSQLRLDQLRQLGWSDPPLELLVLSACRTALGDRDAELGFAGLAVQAGVKSALASLWYVSDVGTLALMTEFYRQLREAPQATLKAEALRQAQLELIEGNVTIESGTLQLPGAAVPLAPELSGIETESLSHPYYWAAFTMTGNPW